MEKSTTKIGKIVYFDEESITDYLQIVAGGELKKTTELIREIDKNASSSASASANFGLNKIFKTLIGFNAEGSASVNGQIAIESKKMVSSILNNTILSDFLDAVNANEDKKTIKMFERYKLSIEKDSLSYIVMISPFMTMINNVKNSGAINNDLDISVDKIDTAVKQGKGYYELLGLKDKNEIIFRFNIDAFKNNYRISDLLKMELTLFATKVGRTKKSNLNFNYELNLGDIETSEPDFFEKHKKTRATREKELDVYDVLFAGVNVYD